MVDIAKAPWAHLLLCAGLWACEEKAPPWSGQPDGGVVDESRPFLPGTQQEGWLGDAGYLDDAGDAEEEEAPVGRPESRVGGLWVSCYGQFQPSGAPEKDVTRLGLMCGPANGMQLVGKTHVGKVAPGKSATHPFSARAGDCYRVFAVASGVTDLDVIIRSSRGTDLARDQSQDAWPIVDPDRPICTFADDHFSVVIGAAAGEGAYALQIWQLPAKKAK